MGSLTGFEMSITILVFQKKKPDSENLPSFPQLVNFKKLNTTHILKLWKQSSFHYTTNEWNKKKV